MSDTFEVPCTVCTKPVVLERPNTGDKEMDTKLLSYANTAAHAVCLAANNKRADQAARLLAMAEKWSMLCDPFYLTSDEWVATHEAAAKVNLKQVAVARAWQWGARGLLLFGRQSGTGKTTAAWLVLKAEVKAGRVVVAMTHAEFARQATMLAREGGPAERRWLALIKDCDVLMVDDLGKSKFTTADGTGKAGEELLFEVVDHRMRKKLPCVLTLNADAAGLKAMMSEDRAEPFVRRLRECCRSLCFDMAKVVAK